MKDKLLEKVYKELAKGPKPNLTKKSVALEEEDYTPTAKDPDEWIKTAEFNEDVTDENI